MCPRGDLLYCVGQLCDVRLCVQIKTYADKYPKVGQEYAQEQLNSVTLPSSFSATFDP